MVGNVALLGYVWLICSLAAPAVHTILGIEWLSKSTVAAGLCCIASLFLVGANL